ncbi:MAG TPA: hypothetical protein ENF22_05320 [Chloroflexi bacterium]|nr:hypothetical protein [Chloroflexota bacterium]
MERTVPYTASEEVELYQRTYYSLLRTSDTVQIRSIEEVHAGMNSLLHQHARHQEPDMMAFIYALLRLPECVRDTKEIVLGQTGSVFEEAGLGNVWDWEQVSGKARRRRCFYNSDKNILACIIASRSDIDDVIPMITAYQIEWNKIHQLMQYLPDDIDLTQVHKHHDTWYNLAEALMMSVGDLTRWRSICGDDFAEWVGKIKSRELNFQVRLLNGSLIEYNRATNDWWKVISGRVPELLDRPVYFISSNTHSFANLLSGFALKNQKEINQYLVNAGQEELLEEWNQIQAREVPSSQENFLYYALKKYIQEPGSEKIVKRRADHEKSSGIHRISSEHSFDVAAQVFDLSKLKQNWLDPRITSGLADLDFLTRSDALILNIDYPLGLAAYNLLMKVAENAGSILGVYTLGKAATLNGVVGDVIIPYVVHDEHSRNTYLCPRAFEARDVRPYLVYGTVLDNQKAVTVKGTFLQNPSYMDVFYREGYTGIEMEAGPYLSAVFEMFRPYRHPVDEIVNLDRVPFDLGILHYASDRPLSKGKNLGAGTLSYYGMDPTYACSLAIIRRIFELEQKRLQKS